MGNNVKHFNKVSVQDGIWTEVSKLTASDAATYDLFGSSVAITSDGLVAMVGAYAKNTDGLTRNGQVYTYKRDNIGDAWTKVNKLTASDKADDDQFGISVAITGDGLVAMVGADGKDTNNLTDHGQVYTYTTDILP